MSSSTEETMDTGPIDLDRIRPVERVLYEVKRVIVGQDHLLERLLVALLARGHILVEGVPGLAKTMAIKTLADTIGGRFKRIQFTPDLVPADLIGTRIYDQKAGDFATWLGPVFANLLLADEINRAPAKVQSALLEVMQERQVGPAPVAQQVLTSEALADLQRQVDGVYVDPALIEYAVRMVSATRAPEEHGIREIGRYITFGASPRASINLILSAKALAFVRGRDYALSQDVLDMSLDVMRHRLVLSYEALTDDVTADDLLRTIIGRIPVPVVPLHGHSDIRVSA
jgi:MoxR-like ATPase